MRVSDSHRLDIEYFSTLEIDAQIFRNQYRNNMNFNFILQHQRRYGSTSFDRAFTAAPTTTKYRVLIIRSTIHGQSLGDVTFSSCYIVYILMLYVKIELIT